MYQPSAIGLDLIFPEKDRTSPQAITSFYKRFFNISSQITGLPAELQDNDIIFAQSLKNSNATLGLYLSENKVFANDCNPLPYNNVNLDTFNLKKSQYMTCDTPQIRDAVDNFGFLNMSADEDGMLRRIPLFKSHGSQQIPVFALATLLSIDPNFALLQNNSFTFLGHQVKTDEATNVLLNNYHNNWYKKVSIVDILNGTVAKEMLRGKIILLGSSAVALHDQVILSNGIRSLGIKVHVTFIDNLLRDSFLYQPEYFKYINVLFSLFMSLLFFYLLIKKRNSTILFLFIGVLSLSGVMSFSVLAYFGAYISFAYFLFPYLLHFFLVSVAYIVIDTYERKAFSEELNRSHVALLDSMVYVAEVHDIETGTHIIRTKKYIKHLAMSLYNKGIYTDYLSPQIIEMMYRTAPLHDVGKIGIEDSILKKPGKLTPTEYKVMQTHAELGMHIIDNAISNYKTNDFFIMAKNIAHHHHEKWDGTGYPDGLSGEAIPIEARFMAIADVYDALVSERVYKKPFSFEKTLAIIKEGRGTHFDPVLVDAFLEIQEDFKNIAQQYSDDTQS